LTCTGEAAAYGMPALVNSRSQQEVRGKE